MGWCKEANVGSLEQPDKGHPRHKSADVRKPGDTPATTTQARTSAEELQQEPEP